MASIYRGGHKYIENLPVDDDGDDSLVIILRNGTQLNLQEQEPGRLTLYVSTDGKDAHEIVLNFNTAIDAATSELKSEPDFITCPSCPTDRVYGIRLTPEQRKDWKDHGICPMCNHVHK